MDAAEQFAADENHTLGWVEISRRYPDQYVCLVDIVRAELRSPEIISARVVRVCTEPLIRPSLVIDDDTLALLAEPLKRPSLADHDRSRC